MYQLSIVATTLYYQNSSRNKLFFEKNRILNIFMKNIAKKMSIFAIQLVGQNHRQ